MAIKRRDFQKASTFIHEFLLKLSTDVDCAELRDSLNCSLLYMQRYYHHLRSRIQPHPGTSPLPRSGGFSPITPFRDAPDKFLWKWIKLEDHRQSVTFSSDTDVIRTLPHFLEAAKNGHDHLIRQLVQEDEGNLLEIDALGRNALMYAVQFGHLCTIQLLVDLHIDIDAVAHDGSTAVHRACHNGNIEALQILVEANADLTVEDTHSRQPIHWACANKNRECLRILIEQKVPVYVRDRDGMTPSMWACRMDNIDHFELLTEVEGQPEDEEDGLWRDYSGKTWLHWSVRRTEPLECLRTLLTGESAHAQDKGNKTVMHIAAEQGALSAAKVIIEIAGPSCLEDRDGLNRTPLILATMGGHGELVNFLLSQADLSAVDNFNSTAWDYACARKLHYCLLIIASYIRQRALTDSREHNGQDLQDIGAGSDVEDRATNDFGQMTLNNTHDAILHQYQPAPPPYPPKEPVTPRTPRAPVAFHTGTAQGTEEPPMSQSGQHLITQVGMATEGPLWSRSAGVKRLPMTPEDDNGDMMFERSGQHFDGTESTNKRMRNEETMNMSVMSVEASEPQSYPKSNSVYDRDEAGVEEPEMQNDTQYIEEEKDERTDSINAMDVSDFEGEEDPPKKEEIGMVHQQHLQSVPPQPPPQPHPRQHPPPVGPGPGPPHYQKHPSNYNPPPTPRDVPYELRPTDYANTPDYGNAPQFYDVEPQQDTDLPSQPSKRPLPAPRTDRQPYTHQSDDLQSGDSKTFPPAHLSPLPPPAPKKKRKKKRRDKALYTEDLSPHSPPARGYASPVQSSHHIPHPIPPPMSQRRERNPPPGYGMAPPQQSYGKVGSSSEQTGGFHPPAAMVTATRKASHNKRHAAPPSEPVDIDQRPQIEDSDDEDAMPDPAPRTRQKRQGHRPGSGGHWGSMQNGNIPNGPLMMDAGYLHQNGSVMSRNAQPAPWTQPSRSQPPEHQDHQAPSPRGKRTQPKSNIPRLGHKQPNSRLPSAY